MRISFASNINTKRESPRDSLFADFPLGERHCSVKNIAGGIFFVNVFGQKFSWPFSTSLLFTVTHFANFTRYSHKGAVKKHNL